MPAKPRLPDDLIDCLNCGDKNSAHQKIYHSKKDGRCMYKTFVGYQLIECDCPKFEPKPEPNQE